MLSAAVQRWNGGAVCLCWLLAIGCFTCTALAQYRVECWTTDNGLPYNQIQGLWQTRDAYLWLTTPDGVARFDGVRFRVFNKSNTPGLTSYSFSYHALWEDRQGNLWMGTEDGGVMRYRGGVFTSYTTKEGLPSNDVLRVDEDATGTVWIYTRGGLAQWKQGRLTRPGPALETGASLKAPGYSGTYGESYGLWRASAGVWQRFAYGQWTPFPLPPQVRGPARLNIGSLSEDAEGRLWYSLNNREGEHYCLSQGRLSVLPAVPNARGVQVRYRDRQGRLWVASREGRVRLWKNGQAWQITGLSTLEVFQPFQDREGTLWIGTLGQGLCRLREQPVTVYRRPGGPAFNRIGPIRQDRMGRVWVGSGGLARFEDGRFENFYRPRRSRDPGDSGNRVSSLWEDRDGGIWAATLDGIVRFRDGELREEQDLSSQVKGRVWAISQDRYGALWFGGEQGLYRLQQGKVRHYPGSGDPRSGVVNVLYQDPEGTLWVGGNGGLSRVTEEGLAAVKGLSGREVSVLYRDGAGVLWVGTYHDGLYRFEEGRLTHYTSEQGLYNNRILHILEDDLGSLWVGCHLGLYRLRKQQLNDYAAGRVSAVTSTHFGKADGLINLQCRDVQPGAFKAQDGKLWFATEGGLAVVDPRAVSVNLKPPPVVIEETLLDRRPVPIESGLRIEPGRENLDIHYTALSFIRPEQLRFRYKLEGLDREWVEAGTRRTAYYSHLPPGDYVFRVTATNSDGVWNREGQRLRVVVLPPFYRTWWFGSLVALCLGGAVIVGSHYRVARLRRAHTAQQAFSRRLIESQENERQRIAAELHDSLGQNLLVIKNRALLGKLTQPDQRAQAQFDEISASASQTLEEVRLISYNLRPSHLDQLGLRTSLEAMLDKLAESCPIRFSRELDELDGLFAPADEITLYRIVQESLNNVIKHSRATEARVAVRRRERDLTLTVQDNGRGFAPGAPPPATTQGGGFGLSGLAERVRMLGGTHTVDSAPERGTTVTVTLEVSERRQELGHGP
jgi:signal transduction histidine kinase/ligand-binding sensor domain-containing protein